MGVEFSIPEESPDYGYVTVGLSTKNIVSVLHAPDDVINKLKAVVEEVNSLDRRPPQFEGPCHEKKDGYYIFKLSRKNAFNFWGGNTSDAIGKMLILRMLEEMYKLGYDPVKSSVTTVTGGNPCIFFKKVCNGRPSVKVMALNSGSADCFTFFKTDATFVNIVKSAIREKWDKGIKKESTVQVNTLVLPTINMHGYPFGRDDEDSVRSKEMLALILGRLGRYSYKMVLSVNLTDTYDTMYFVKDESYRTLEEDFCLVSLNKDQLGLINCGDMEPLIADAIKQNGHTITTQELMLGRSPVISIDGNPFRRSDDGAINTRRLICRLGETFLAQGWALVDSIDWAAQRKIKDSLLLTRIPEPYTSDFCCVYLRGERKIAFVDMPDYLLDAMKQVVRDLAGTEGIKREEEKENGVYEIKFGQYVWFGGNVYAWNLMSHVLSAANALDWQLVCSAEVGAVVFKRKNQPEQLVDADSWWFVHWPSGIQKM